MPDSQPAVSLCMVVKDEESNLPGCLDSVRGVVSELILVDTGSVDATLAVAERYGATVIPFDFTTVDFSAARNVAIAGATRRWILVLDADERLNPESVGPVLAATASDENAGYIVERYNYSAGSDHPTKDYAVRLFPNRPDYRYRGRVHETIDASILAGGGRLLRTPIRLDHRFSPEPEARRRKNLRYIEILKEEIAADPADDTRLDFLAAEYHQLEMFEEAARVTEQIVRMRPGDPRAHLFAGVYHLLYQGNPSRARMDFAEALRLRPDYAEAASFLQLAEEKDRERT